jgi:hypothetical protein
MVSRFKYKFAAVFILSGVCLQTSVSICVIESDLDQMECVFYWVHLWVKILIMQYRIAGWLVNGEFYRMWMVTVMA